MNDCMVRKDIFKVDSFVQPVFPVIGPEYDRSCPHILGEGYESQSLSPQFPRAEVLGLNSKNVLRGMNTV